MATLYLTLLFESIPNDAEKEELKKSLKSFVVNTLKHDSKKIKFKEKSGSYELTLVLIEVTGLLLISIQVIKDLFKPRLYYMLDKGEGMGNNKNKKPAKSNISESDIADLDLLINGAYESYKNTSIRLPLKAIVVASLDKNKDGFIFSLDIAREIAYSISTRTANDFFDILERIPSRIDH